jgi:predicted neuraminidase
MRQQNNRLFAVPTPLRLHSLTIFLGLIVSHVFLQAALPSGMVLERILGSEIDTGQYKHPSCVTELDNGDLYLTYYGGDGEYSQDTAVFASRLADGTKNWSYPVSIARNPFQSMGNPVVWQSPEGRVWLFFVVRFGETWSTSRIMAKVSDDRGETWSDAFLVSMEEGTMVRGRPIRTTAGRTILPIYHETGTDTEKTGADTSSLFLLFDPKKKRWERSNKVYSRLGNLQPAIVELSPDHLLAFCRRGGDYEPGDDGFVVRTESKDGGFTWSQGEETPFPNPNAAVELIKLKSGNLLFVYNDSMDDRSPLTAALSKDKGKTFPIQVNLREGPQSFAYPTAIQTQDEMIHIFYSTNERTTICRIQFREASLTQQ